MSKSPSPKLDQLRAMRESNYEAAQKRGKPRAARLTFGQVPVEKLRDKVAAIPAKRQKPAKRSGKKR